MKKLSKNQEKVLICLSDMGGEVNTEKLKKATGLTEKQIREATAHLKELGLIDGPESLQEMCGKALKDMDENMSETDESYPYCVVVMASILTDKADERYLADHLSYDDEFVQMAGSRLRNSGVWKGDVFNPECRERLEGETGGIDFWIYCNVAQGDMIMIGEVSDPQISLTDSGMKKGAALFNK